MELKPGKGKYKQNCNVTACQAPGAIVFWNSGTQAYYCKRCAQRITDACRPTVIFPNYDENLKEYIEIINKR